jgi:hypothetical protein
MTAKFEPNEYSGWAETLLKQRPIRASAPVSTDRASYLAAAAVLTDFPIESLCVREGEPPRTDARAVLRDDVVHVPGSHGRCTLKPSARREALRTLGSPAERKRLRALNPTSPATVLQRVYDEFMDGNYEAAHSLDPKDLDAATHVLPWVRALPDVNPRVLPDQRQIQRTLMIRALLSRMEKLAAGFVGRETELADLRGFVGVVAPQSRAESAARVARDFLSWDTRPPLYIQGVGGIGKSALVAEFILEHANSELPFPWVYLDFDDPSLNVESLRSIVLAAADQLGAQYPRGNWTLVRDAALEFGLLQSSADSNSAEPNQTIDTSDLLNAAHLVGPALQRLISTFADAVRSAVGGTSIEQIAGAADTLPLLIVLDTFEEVQKGGLERGQILWRFLSGLQEQVPRLRIVFAGRAMASDLRIGGRPPRIFPLAGFDEQVAVVFLQKHGVKNTEVARALYRQVGGSPLTLSLAARVIQAEENATGTIAGLNTKSYLLFAAGEAVIQGQLYDRILARIRDEDVRAIAHPGLVVRRLTPDVIRYVLAEACGLGEISAERADELFDSLRRQAGLVTTGPDGVLKHQPDVRETMLRLIEGDRPAQVRKIHEAALAFYDTTADQDPVARGEWMYHALKLPIDRRTIEARWTRGVADSVLGSLEELPASSQVLVSMKAGRPLSPELRQAAEAEEWEIEVERKAREAIRHGSIDVAASLVAERKERRPGSGLYAVDALVALGRKDVEKALEILGFGIESVQEAGKTELLIELLRLQGEALGTTSRIAAADRALAKAQRLARTSGLPSLALQILTDRLRIGQKPDVAELDALLRDIPDADFASLQVHLKGLFAAYAADSELLVQKGIAAFVLTRSTVEDAAPELSAMFEGRHDAPVNAKLLSLLRERPHDSSLRTQIGGVLEAALDPRQAQRAR